MEKETKERNVFLANIFRFSLLRNGWTKSNFDSGSDANCYSMKILSKKFFQICYAYVCDNKHNLELEGKYGISWLAIESDDNPPYTLEEIKDMEIAISYAEDNLVNVGIPFVNGYKFHGKNAKEKEKRNNKLRAKYDLDNIQEEDMNKINNEEQ